MSGRFALKKSDCPSGRTLDLADTSFPRWQTWLRPCIGGMVALLVLLGPLDLDTALGQKKNKQREAKQPTAEVEAKDAASPSDGSKTGDADQEAVASQKSVDEPKFRRQDMLIASLTIFLLAIFVGFEVITKVPPTLHTPLMSGSNAISGITIVGALIVAGHGLGFAPFLGFIAVVLATVNGVGGFLVTHRMLAMFKKR
jgi:NAD(P) transhydrogenase subunit alpha